MRYVKVVSGTVTNATQFDSQIPQGWDAPNNWVQSDDAQIGWTYDGSVFTAPPTPPAPPPTAEQTRVAAIRANARRTAIMNVLTTVDDVGLLSAISSQYPGLTGDALKAVRDIYLILIAQVRN